MEPSKTDVCNYNAFGRYHVRDLCESNTYQVNHKDLIEGT